MPLWGMKEGLYLTLRAFKSLRNPKAPAGYFGADDLEVLFPCCRILGVLHVDNYTGAISAFPVMVVMLFTVSLCCAVLGL